MAHFLKRLELNGFKSFAQRTVLEFPAGITAIVGPNGSGKSNVVDAIRWLLGERDAKNLRGGKIDDLIFGGTPKRPRLGQAQATLYFENHNNFFPVDFNEVSIMRQVNRDGTSQYFLNRSEILLRDLVDFYARARLGARGMIVVTQGNSDLFIQAAPLGRREMIEEILGLREYQIKKADAQRRMKTSQQNLEKARGLIEEILPHLRSLKRQTGRWEKREQLEDELRTLENVYFGTQLRLLNDQFAQAEAGITEHEQRREPLLKTRTDAEARQKEVEAEQPQGREELKKLGGEVRELFSRRSEIEKQIGRMEAQIEHEGKGGGSGEAGPHSGQELLKLIKGIQVKLELFLDEPGDWRKMINNILEEIDELLSASAAPVSKPNAAPVAGSSKLLAQLTQLRNELTALDDQLKKLKGKEEVLDKGQEEFYQHFKSAVAMVEAAKDAIEQWDNQHRQRTFEKERIQMRLQELHRQIEQIGRTPSEFAKVEQTSDIGDDHGQIEHRIYKLRGDLASIGEIDAAVVKEADETQERYEFLSKQAQDLEAAQADLRAMAEDLREKIRSEFNLAFVKINKEFDKFFNVMFGGGDAKLVLRQLQKKKEKGSEEDAEGVESAGVHVEVESDQEEKTEDEGVDIEVRLPKKRLNSLEMLSGGERSLVGIAALFALISVSPPPFLVLDEIDAPLDERNARRFSEMLREFSKQTQFVVVTHNRATMEAADVLYGITLEEDGSSKVLSLKLEQ